eukprot:scaffold6.g2702.t1
MLALLLRMSGAGAAHTAAAAAAAGRDARREVAVLGGEDYILSQRSGVEEELFKGRAEGQVLGVDADIAGVAFRQQSGLRSLAHLPAGLEPPRRVLERVAVHYARNLLAGRGALPGQVPLVLGIWGPKGAGKTFTLELCLRRMGVSPVCLSAGELEDEWAGEPGRRLRERYSFAARHAESTGEATALVISDLDIGVGAFANTFNTVNSQNLQGALMALCDDPLAVSTGQAWGALRPRQRVPVFVTANDLSCLYAPLVRDGRMDKLLYEPSRDEMAAMLRPLFAPGLSAGDVDALLAAFPGQPMDFFGAVKSRLVDGAVRRWLAQQQAQQAQQQAAGEQGAEAQKQQQQQQPAQGEQRSAETASAEGALAALLMAGGGAAVEAAAAEAVTRGAALAAAGELAAEQQVVLDMRLSRNYMKGLENDVQQASERRARWRRRAAADAARKLAAAEATEAARRAAREAVRAAAAGEARRRAADEVAGAERTAADGAEPAGPPSPEAEEQPEPEAAPAPPSGLPLVTPDQLAAALGSRAAVVLDVRPAREASWGAIKGAKHAPYVLAAGSSLAPEVRPNPGFLEAAAAALGPPAAAPHVVLCGPGAPLDASASASFVSKELFVSVAPNGTAAVDGEDIVAAAARALEGAGYGQLSELEGGFRAWDLAYRPDGRRRAKGAFRDKSSGARGPEGRRGEGGRDAPPPPGPLADLPNGQPNDGGGRRMNKSKHRAEKKAQQADEHAPQQPPADGDEPQGNASVTG